MKINGKVDYNNFNYVIFFNHLNPSYFRTKKEIDPFIKDPVWSSYPIYDRWGEEV